jgi:type VI protein secretion system component Hcp
MIQLNLLPDVKLEYIKAQRQRRLIFTVSAIASIVAIGILLALLAVGGLQKKYLGDLNDDIAAASSKLKGKPEIDKILTVQNQLNSLTALHDAKPAASRLFTYLNQVTPAEVSIGDFKVDFVEQTATITGTTTTLGSVNKYIDTLKFTTYRTGQGNDQSDATKAFSNVVLSSFSLEGDDKNGKPAKYTVTLNYDPVIFDLTQEVSLSVPNTTTTRSALSNPTDLFQAIPQSGGGGN